MPPRKRGKRTSKRGAPEARRSIPLPILSPAPIRSPHRYAITAMSSADWASFGLRAPLARATHALVRAAVKGQVARQKAPDAVMKRFLQQVAIATEHERMALQDVFAHSDLMAAAVVNGCGPDGLGLLVPDWCGAFTECCDEHDRCYARGGTEGDRFQCDLRLYECMKSIGPDWLASMYFWSVRALGTGAFTYKEQCRGTCEQLQREVVDLTGFATLDRNGNTIAGFVNATGRRMLEHRAAEQTQVETVRGCQQGCTCNADTQGSWTDRPTVLRVALRTPGGDLQGFVQCEATMRTRTLTGRCGKP